jgi:hypothetical protein
LDVYSWPSGAQVTVDGEAIGGTPARIPLDPGQHSVELLKPAYEQWKTSFQISLGEEKSIEATLTKQNNEAGKQQSYPR